VIVAVVAVGGVVADISFDGALVPMELIA